ncbi:hypothetical protein QG37_06370 [Candidozyma auris]|uniref:Uncharacterized protein n=1 Tax=Candidozyma auris TaxID=498019 RepID=A0A0L0NSM1_CANAR|nr:hypothetical protein QG37_06370 [[Candida] auris]
MLIFDTVKKIVKHTSPRPATVDVKIVAAAKMLNFILIVWNYQKEKVVRFNE